jgi:hypothetical protein
MIASSAAAFRSAVMSHRLDPVEIDPVALDAARASLDEAGLLLIGEPHGVRETSNVLYHLARELGARAIAFEWSFEEMDAPLRELLDDGEVDFDRLWELPPTAELFCGDGRITAGHFAALLRLREDGLLDQVIAFDQLDPDPPPVPPTDWRVRERDMAGRLLQEWAPPCPLLALTGTFHTLLAHDDGATMAMLLARERPIRPAMLDYAEGGFWSGGKVHDVSRAARPAPIRFALPLATPAVVPGTSST